MGPEAAVAAGISHEDIGVEMSLKSAPSSEIELAGEFPLLRAAVDVGDADVDS